MFFIIFYLLFALVFGAFMASVMKTRPGPAWAVFFGLLTIMLVWPLFLFIILYRWFRILRKA